VITGIDPRHCRDRQEPTEPRVVIAVVDHRVIIEST
jgi:hypothetical protein